MKVVYLDQNKWIELSREAYLRDSTHRLRHVLKAARACVHRGLACFPLSQGHYVETHRAPDPRRRWRLALFMRELSEERTFGSPARLVAREIDEALSQFFPERVTVRAFEWLGRGYDHTSEFATDDGRIVHPASLDPNLRGALKLLEDLVLLSATMPRFSGGLESLSTKADEAQMKEPEQAFHRHLERWAHRSPRLPADLRDRILYGNELKDIIEVLAPALQQHRISADELQALAFEGLKTLVDSMPSRRVQLHLHRQVTKNPRLRIKPNDLTDWVYVGAAVAYCDVVVTEKLFADLVTRDNFKAKATVISDLRDLPALLVS